MTDESIANRIRETTRLEPAASLRARVLDAAAPLVRPSAIWADRVWCSRAWRLAAVATVLMLVALEQMSLPGVDRTPGPSANAMAAAAAAEETALQLGMTPGEARALGRRAMADAVAPSSKSSGAAPETSLPVEEGEIR